MWVDNKDSIYDLLLLAPAYYDPYNNVSYLELNKRRYGEIERHESEKLENR